MSGTMRDASAPGPVLPINGPPGSKACRVRGWQRLTADEAAALPHWRRSDVVAVARRLDGLTVIDIDRPEMRDEVLDLLGLAGCETWETRTPSGGAHLWFAGRRRPAKLPDGAGEVKSGAGHYVLVERLDAGHGQYIARPAPMMPVPTSYRHPAPAAPAAAGGGGASASTVGPGGSVDARARFDSWRASVGLPLRHAGAAS